MHNHTAKKDAIEAIAPLPDNVPMNEILYRLCVPNKVRQGMQDIEAGRGMERGPGARDRAVVTLGW